mmetsp:Transcript_19162/g.41751  ORF Transcript_19162/g.41751 Transcript_19162/m.41751 type:complete len:206 (-) Transcript_19162:161-778(-)
MGFLRPCIRWECPYSKNHGSQQIGRHRHRAGTSPFRNTSRDHTENNHRKSYLVEQNGPAWKVLDLYSWSCTIDRPFPNFFHTQWNHLTKPTAFLYPSRTKGGCTLSNNRGSHRMYQRVRQTCLILRQGCPHVCSHQYHFETDCLHHFPPPKGCPGHHGPDQPRCAGRRQILQPLESQRIPHRMLDRSFEFANGRNQHQHCPYYRR